jgi:tRNA (mo5U34)-methyltransferase
MKGISVEQQIRQLDPWFHNLHLPDGQQTAPTHSLGDFPRCKWEEIEGHLPADLRDTEILDIGCNAGYYSFELARRGARVTALDVDSHYLTQARWAAGILGLEKQVRFHQIPVYQLAHSDRQYDLVWFMGVLYHLRYPLLALDIIRQRCRGRMVFQTMTAPGEDVFPVAENYALHERQVMAQPGWPKLAFIEHRIADDPTNWWAPDHAAVEALLRSAGFTGIERIAHEIYICESSGQAPGEAELLDVTAYSHER